VRESGLRLIARSADETRAIGARLAAAIIAADPSAPFVIGLTGDLGAGKTTLVGGVLSALGHQGPVRSPTYTLIEPYRLVDRDLNHCDLYRLRAPAELDDLGLRDLLSERSVLLVEWPERAGDRLGKPDLSLALGYLDDGRIVDFHAASEAGRQVLSRLALDKT
jgi:tRNA threonylcarbamoyladenosine biosynthesis protein TsaE